MIVNKQIYTPEIPTRVSLIIGTFGEASWAKQGLQKAMDVFCVQTQAPETIWVHAETLAEARNFGAELATSEWLVFLDADDDLDHWFCRRLADDGEDADVLHTSVRGFNQVGYIEQTPVFNLPQHPLITQNYLVIGSPVRASLFREVGGFDEWECLEDWALWLKCQKAGARFGQLPQAVYLINDDHSRNTGDQDTVARQIREKYR